MQGNPKLKDMLISTHAPLAGRDLILLLFGLKKWISTHAPLAGRDADKRKQKTNQNISTHAPLAGRDP